jgi:uncharacterized protein (TIGR01777 family)
MKVTITGATGPIGSKVVAELKARDDQVTVLSRDPERAQAVLGGVEAHAWDPEDGRAPTAALAGRDAVLHLAGEPIDQRWTSDAKRRIRVSREQGLRNLVAGLEAADPRPGALVSASGIDYYGALADEVVDEHSPPGSGFLPEVCVAWEAGARAAESLGLRVVTVRTGIVLDRDSGALKTMLLPFKLGVGGPVAGGRQYMAWVHIDDVAGIYAQALSDGAWSGAVNATAPEPVTNREFSRALGRALHRPAITPVPALAVRTLYGEKAALVIEGRRAIPWRTRQLGYRFRHPDLGEALRSVLRG